MTDLRGFKERFKIAIDYWGDESFPEPYRERAEFKTRDLTWDEMRDLCHVLMDNCERPPSMVKLVAYISVIKGRRGQKQIAEQKGEIECQLCDDLGVVRVKSEERDFVMRCENLKCRPSYYWELPRWSDLFDETFKKSKCPIEWFHPPVNGTFPERLESSLKNWRQKIQISQVALKDMGFDCETTSKEIIGE